MCISTASSSLSDCISVSELLPTLRWKEYQGGLGRVEALVGALFGVIALPVKLFQRLSPRGSIHFALLGLSMAELAFFFYICHLHKQCFFCFFTAFLEGQSRLTKNPIAEQRMFHIAPSFVRFRE